MIARLRTLAVCGLAVVACKPAGHASAPAVSASAIEIGRDGAAVRGLAADLASTYAVVVTTGEHPTTTLEARHGATIAWRRELPGSGGAIARAGELVIVAIAGSGAIGSATAHGEPGSVLAAFHAATGEPAWTLAIDAGDYALVTGIAALPDGGIVVGGTFAGTLRIGAHVAASGGAGDGFVARVEADGQPRWLVRVGGPGADGVQGVAAAPNSRIAIAGTFTSGAELAGQALAPFDARSVLGDAFVAELDAATGAPAWIASYGGKADDPVVGVAVDDDGHVAVAGALRATLHVGGQDLGARGVSDGLVSLWSPDGAPLAAAQLGGADVDTLDAIVAARGGGFVVGGAFAGTLAIGPKQLVAGGGDDAFVVRLDGAGVPTHAWQLGGNGREQVIALTAAPGGYALVAGHTDDLVFDGAHLAASKDPLAGAGLIVRPLVAAPAAPVGPTLR